MWSIATKTMHRGGELDFIFALAFLALVFLYWINDAFRYHLRLSSYYVFFFCISVVILPVLMINGRSRKNIFWCQVCQRLSGWLYGLQSTVVNGGNLVTDGPSVIVSNHQCALDVTGMGKLFSERSTILAKKELLYAGPFGLAIWLSGFVFVQRSNRASSREIMAKVAKEITKEGLCVWIFPEGTRNMSQEMLPFKKGAFNLAVESQVPIVPVVFSSYEKFFNPAKYHFTAGNYIVEVMPPIPTKGLTPENVPDLANDVRLKMMETFKRISAKDYD